MHVTHLRDEEMLTLHDAIKHFVERCSAGLVLIHCSERECWKRLPALLEVPPPERALAPPTKPGAARAPPGQKLLRWRECPAPTRSSKTKEGGATPSSNERFA